MLNKISQHNKRLMIIADTAIIIISFFLGYFIRSRVEPGLFPVNEYIVILPIVILIYYGLLQTFGAYSSFRAKNVFKIISVVFKSSLTGFLIFGSSLYILKIQDFSRSLFLIIYMLSGIFIVIFRILVLYILRFIRNKGYDTRYILLIGTGQRTFKYYRNNFKNIFCSKRRIGTKGLK